MQMARGDLRGFFARPVAYGFGIVVRTILAAILFNAVSRLGGHGPKPKGQNP